MSTIPYEPLSTLLVSPLITPIEGPYCRAHCRARVRFPWESWGGKIRSRLFAPGLRLKAKKCSDICRDYKRLVHNKRRIGPE